jgi:hypothetical protein
MTTTQTHTDQEQRVCGQTFAALGSLGVVIHVAHELLSPDQDGMSGAQIAILVAVVLATVATTAAWYRLGRATRRVTAVVLGLAWAFAASEHVVAIIEGRGTWLDATGVLAFLGGFTLVFAAYYDFRRPLDGAL